MGWEEEEERASELLATLAGAEGSQAATVRTEEGEALGRTARADCSDNPSTPNNTGNISSRL